MKKKLVLILATLMCVSLCACGGGNASSSSATITLADGTTETLTSKELYDKKESNSKKYNETYSNSKIEITDKITKISGPYYDNEHDTPYYNFYEVELSGGWTVWIGSENDVLNSADVGSTIKVSGVSIKEVSVSGVTLCFYNDYKGWRADEVQVELID